MPDFQNQKKVRVKPGIGLKIYMLVGFEISLDLSFSIFVNVVLGAPVYLKMITSTDCAEILCVGSFWNFIRGVFHSFWKFWI